MVHETAVVAAPQKIVVGTLVARVRLRLRAWHRGRPLLRHERRRLLRQLRG